MIITAFDKHQRDRLISCGVPAQEILAGRHKVDVGSNLLRIPIDIPNVPPSSIAARTQQAFLEKLVANPIGSPLTLCIASFPTDLRAKHLAQYIMLCAIQAYTAQSRHGKVMPVWHRVYGGFGDSLRDSNDVPCLIVIANVSVKESSSAKIEKVRDILEKFPQVPRIVVVGGEMPFSLFATRLNYPLTKSILIGPDASTREISL